MKKIFWILFWVLVTWVYVNVKIQRTGQFRSVYFIVCKSYLQKLKWEEEEDEEGRRDAEREGEVEEEREEGMAGQ